MHFLVLIEVRTRTFVNPLHICSQHTFQKKKFFLAPSVGLKYTASYQLIIHPGEDGRRDNNGQANGDFEANGWIKAEELMAYKLMGPRVLFKVCRGSSGRAR